MLDLSEEIKQNTNSFVFREIENWLKKALGCKGNKEQNSWLLIEVPEVRVKI